MHVRVILCSLALVACAPEARPRYRIVVKIESDPGVALAGAHVRMPGAPVRESDTNGTVTADLVGRAGDVVAVQVECPEGYRSPDRPLTALLRALDERDRHPEFHVSCPLLRRKLVVAVRAQHGPGLPLRYLGEEIARTDASGSAHALLTAAPGDTLTLTLDTSHAPKLMPQHPELKVTLKERDEIVVFDQAFTAPKPPKPKPRTAPEPELPRRI